MPFQIVMPVVKYSTARYVDELVHREYFVKTKKRIVDNRTRLRKLDRNRKIQPTTL